MANFCENITNRLAVQALGTQKRSNCLSQNSQNYRNLQKFLDIIFSHGEVQTSFKQFRLGIINKREVKDG